jgi:hypothetical protein
MIGLVTDWGVMIFTCEGRRRENNTGYTHTHRILVSVTTTSSSKPEVVITPVGRGALFLPNHMTFVLEVFRTRLRVEKACWTLRKLCCRAFNTKSGEGPAEYKTVSSTYKLMRELPTS